jgi:hypothetical protein
VVVGDNTTPVPSGRLGSSSWEARYLPKGLFPDSIHKTALNESPCRQVNHSLKADGDFKDQAFTRQGPGDRISVSLGAKSFNFSSKGAALYEFGWRMAGNKYFPCEQVVSLGKKLKGCSWVQSRLAQFCKLLKLHIVNDVLA